MIDRLKRSELLLLTLLVLFWVVELWVVQERVLVPIFKAPEMVATRQLFRLGLDVGLVGAAVLLLPRNAVIAVLVFEFVFFVFGGVYYDYYGRLPRLTMLTRQASEGASIWGLVIGMIRPLRLLAFTALLSAKIVLVMLAARAPERLAPRARRIGLSVAALLYLTLFVVANLTFDPLANMRRWGNAARFGMTYGFAIPLAVEAWDASSESLLERALDSARKSPDALAPIEATIPMDDRVVFVQFESLDWGALGFRFEGREVTPRVNALRATSMVYKAEAAHFTGSADADFVATMARWPSRDVVTYKIESYPFGDALPHRARPFGYRTSLVHGVTGEFFNRREAFTEMGFDQLFFREELAARGVVATYAKYDWIQDAELFEFASQQLARESGRAIHLIITVTSHSPFTQLPPGERARCGGSGIAADYFCSIEYTDRALGKYLDAMPVGTTVVIYGDHNSSVESPGYDSGRKDDRDWVPVIVHSNARDLSKLQRSSARATDGSLTFVDVTRWFHRQILRAPKAGP